MPVCALRPHVLTGCACVPLFTRQVVDDSYRLDCTLCHELCHVAAWLVDHVSKPPHGPVFKKWAGKAAAALPGLQVTTCHHYEIRFAYNYECATDWCRQQYGRHSNSIDVATQRCGVCSGTLREVRKANADGTPATPRAAAGFSLFVKERFASTKAAMPAGTPHKDVMKALSTQWKAEKEAGAPGSAAARAAGAAEGADGGQATAAPVSAGKENATPARRRIAGCAHCSVLFCAGDSRAASSSVLRGA